MDYDVVSGVGFGALNAAVFASYPRGMEHSAVDELLSIWSSFDSDISMYKNWMPLSIITGLLQKDALFNSAPLETSMKTLLDG